MLLESTHKRLRPKLETLYKDAALNTDLVIVTMSSSGEMEKAFNINYNNAKIYMNIGSHAGFVFGDDYVFGAHSDGFKTKVQTK